MTEKELGRLKRSELLEMLLELKKKNEAIEQELEEKQRIIEDRAIQLEEAGSIAQASLKLNGVFAAAQAACEQYTENIKRLEKQKEAQMQDTKHAAEKMIENARRECEEWKRRTEAICAQKEIETEEKCRLMRIRAQEDAEKQWEEISKRLEDFYRAHEGLKRLLTNDGDIQRNSK